jgi:hypothetical protein
MASVKKLSLADTHPELAVQAHGWDPLTVTFGSHKKPNGFGRVNIFGKHKFTK